jgi:hypothetical protein
LKASYFRKKRRNVRPSVSNEVGVGKIRRLRVFGFPSIRPSGYKRDAFIWQTHDNTTSPIAFPAFAVYDPRFGRCHYDAPFNVFKLLVCHAFSPFLVMYRARS